MQKLTPQERRAHNKELILSIMQEDFVSAKELAKAARISPDIVQGLRLDKRKNLTLQSFLKLIDALGYSLVLEKSGKGKSKLA